MPTLEPTKKYSKIDSFFTKISNFTSRIVGSPAWFFFSLTVVIIWIPSRFLFKSDELWHLFINTFTTILTFLMMSLLHSSQSRWEKKIEQLQVKEEKILKHLEKEFETTIETVTPGTPETQSTRPSSGMKITSLL